MNPRRPACAKDNATTLAVSLVARGHTPADDYSALELLLGRSAAFVGGCSTTPLLTRAGLRDHHAALRGGPGGLRAAPSPASEPRFTEAARIVAGSATPKSENAAQSPLDLALPAGSKGGR